MKKLLTILLASLMLFAGCTPAPDQPEQTAELQHSGTEVGFKMLRYNWDGYGVGTKEIYTCELSYAILDQLSALRETGETIPEISDEIVDEYAGELPVTPGTVWIECGTVGLFRLNREMTEICKVQTHLGAGKALQMTEELQDLLNQAWFYYPYDCWSGSCENGEITLQQIAKAESAVASVTIDRISVENKPHSENNQITLRILADESKKVVADLRSYQSDDNLAAGDSKEIKLVKGKETTVTFTFGGFYNHPYSITVMIDNTRITLTIDPKSAN